MKVVYFENVRIPSERAHAYQIVQTVMGFSRRGAEVILVNPRRTTQDVFSYFHLPPGSFRHVLLAVFDPLSWKWFSMKRLAYHLQRWSFTRAAAHWVAGQTADVWYTRDPWLVNHLSPKTKGGAWVLELHNAEGLSANDFRSMQGRIALFVVISQGLRERLIELGVPSDRICVAPDGFDPSAFVSLPSRAEARQALGIAEDRFVAIYAGGFYPWKGVDLMVRSWKQAPEQATLVLIGGPDGDRARLEALVKGIPSSSLKLLPQRPHQEVIRLLVGADVGLLPTSPAFEIGRSYTSPLKQFEYLAVGLPVLAADVPSSHEVLNDQAARFFSYDETSFLSSLKAVMEDVGWRKQAREEGKKLVQAYSWDARAKTIFERMERIGRDGTGVLS
jgi:glycosyltransferase involved in cell wall biosynthesis